jgi:hypothetical protein
VATSPSGAWMAPRGGACLEYASRQSITLCGERWSPNYVSSTRAYRLKLANVTQILAAKCHCWARTRLTDSAGLAAVEVAGREGLGTFFR